MGIRKPALTKPGTVDFLCAVAVVLALFHAEVASAQSDRIVKDDGKVRTDRLRLKKLLSAEASAACPVLLDAIGRRQSTEILLCCYAGLSSNSRLTALSYFLQFETYAPSYFDGRLHMIVRERRLRLQEIDAATRIDPEDVKPGKEDFEIRIHHEKLCSPDPELAEPELRRAIQFRKTPEILLCSFTGGHARCRILAISYCLHHAGAEPDEFRARITSVCEGICQRLCEVDTASAEPTQFLPAKK